MNPVIQPEDAGCQALIDWRPTDFERACRVGDSRWAKYSRDSFRTAFVIDGTEFYEDRNPSYVEFADHFSRFCLKDPAPTQR